MTIAFDVIFLLLAILAVLALLLRISCPPGHALVLTQRSSGGSLRKGPAAFRVLIDRGTFRVPSIASVDLLDLTPLHVETIVALVSPDGGHHGQVRAAALFSVSRDASKVRRAAVRTMGMPRRTLEALCENALAVAVRYGMAGRDEKQEASASSRTESEVAKEVIEALAIVLDELGMEISELEIHIKKRDDARHAGAA